MTFYYVQSLFIFFAVFSLLGGLAALLFYSRLDSSAKYWVTGALLAGVTTMATAFRNELPLLWSYSIAIGLSGTSYILMAWGIARLHDQRPQHRQLLGLGLGSAVFIMALEWCRVNAAPELTLLMSGGLFGLTAMWGSYHANVHFKLTGNPFSNHMRWVMLALGLLHLLRTQGFVTGWGLNTFGQNTWTYSIWTGAFILGMLRYFFYMAMRIHEQTQTERLVTTALALEEERRRLGEQLARQDRLQSLGVMSASFAHELNQPLATILNYTELLQHQLKNGNLDRQNSQHLLEDIVASSVRAGEILRRIRHFIQPATLKKELVDLRGVIDEVCALVEPEARRADIDIVKPMLPSAPIWVLGDAVQLSQVLFNVTRNAMESVATAQIRCIRLEIGQNNRDIWLEVHDTGPGLSKVAAEQAGDPFYSTKISGLGMGLSISKTILSQFDGRMSLENTAHGACARITLPCVNVA